MADGIYFAKDKQIIIMDGNEYGCKVNDVTLNNTSIVKSDTKVANIQVGSEDDTDTYSMVAPLTTVTEILYDESGNSYENKTVVVPDSDFTSWLNNEGYDETNGYPCSGFAGKHTHTIFFSSVDFAYAVKYLYASSDGKSLYVLRENAEIDEISTNCDSISVIHTRII